MKVNLTIGIPSWLDRIFTWPVTLYRRCKYGYSFRRIYLGEGKFTIVDPPDFYRFNIFNWSPGENASNNYAVRLISGPKNKTGIVSLHREIMNHPKGFLIDHENGNGLDNRRENLRLATRSQNQFNKRKTRSKTSSRFVGVYFERRKNRWMATIHYQGKRIWLGSFKSEIDAGRAYDRAATKYHGEFARLNFS